MENGTNPVSLTSRIAAEILLGKIRLNPHQGEPPYLQPIREMVMQMRRAVGKEGFATLSQELKPAVHALADMLFDAVSGVESKKTVEGLKKLSVPFRVAVEQTAAALTGRLDPRERHWEDTLWEMRKYFNRVVTLSVSGITPEEMRDGFDPVVHGIVDELFEKKAVAVS